MSFDRYNDIDWMLRDQERRAIADMFSPVRCTHCSRIYDLGKVTVTARYLDCSMWKSPCCGITVDDRGAGWKSRPDIEHLSNP